MMKSVVLILLAALLPRTVPGAEDTVTHGALRGISRIIALGADDTGDGADTTSIDVVQSSCDDGSDEPFFDTVMKVRVQNTTSTTFFIRRVSFVVNNPYGAGGVLRTRRFALVGSGEVPAERNADLKALFLDVAGSGKTYAGESEPIPAGLGFRNVRVRLHGRDARRRAVTLRGRTVLSFDAFDRCS